MLELKLGIAQEKIVVGEEPRMEDLLLEVGCVPVKDGTLVQVKSDVLESVMEGFLQGGKDFVLINPFTSATEGLWYRGLPRYGEWKAPAFMRAPEEGFWFTESGGQYNPLPLLLKGLKEGKEITLGPTSKAMREAYVSALLNWGEDLFRTYGDTRGVRGVLRMVKDV